MQIGYDQKAVFVPIKRAPRIGEQRNTGKNNEIALAFCQISRRLAQLMASLISSSAASAKSVSEASQ